MSMLVAAVIEPLLETVLEETILRESAQELERVLTETREVERLYEERTDDDFYLEFIVRERINPRITQLRIDEVGRERVRQKHLVSRRLRSENFDTTSDRVDKPVVRTALSLSYLLARYYERVYESTHEPLELMPQGVHELNNIQESLQVEDLVRQGLPEFVMQPQVQFTDNYGYIDQVLLQQPNPQELVQEQFDIVNFRQKYEQLSATQRAYGQYLIGRYRSNSAQSRRYDVKLTGMTRTGVSAAGAYRLVRYAVVKYLERGLLKAARKPPRPSIAAINRKGANEIFISSVLSGVLGVLDMNALFNADYNVFYGVLRTYSLLNLMFRPHLVSYYFAKSLGVPEAFLNVFHGSVYFYPRLNKYVDILFGDSIPYPQKIWFMERPIRKWKTSRDTGFW